MGSYTSVINDTDNTMYIKYGINMFALTIVGYITACLGIVAAVGGVFVIVPATIAIGLGLSLGSISLASLAIESIRASAENEGYHLCAPGGRYRSEKLSLSLLHQANVIIYKKTSDTTIRLWTGAFTVWSGPWADSDLEYPLSEELGGLEYQDTTIVADTDNNKERTASLLDQYRAQVKAHKGKGAPKPALLEHRAATVEPQAATIQSQA